MEISKMLAALWYHLVCPVRQDVVRPAETFTPFQLHEPCLGNNNLGQEKYLPMET